MTSKMDFKMAAKLLHVLKIKLITHYTFYYTNLTSKAIVNETNECRTLRKRGLT